MSDRLDSFARRAAQPMTRARALKLAGGAIVAASFPGLVSPPPVAGSGRRLVGRASQTCQGCPTGEFLCSIPRGVGCIRVCCPEGWVCCKSDDEVQCCYPGQTCAVSQPPGATRPNIVCAGCRTGQEECGGICCSEGSTCADPDLEYCCRPRQTPCRGGGTVTCCGLREECCRGKCCEPGDHCCNGRCCTGNRRCHKGRCRKCPPKTRQCGKRSCCERGEECCDGRCCDKKEKCCGGDHCCNKNEDCCGGGCCSETQKCCGNDRCCDRGDDCCGDRCCKDGKICSRNQITGAQVCCPRARLIVSGTRRICCQPGEVATGDRCCPSTRPNCTECDPPCRVGRESCRNGFCLEV
jgi:hypothetical protein